MNVQSEMSLAHGLKAPECASRLGFIHVPDASAPVRGEYRLSTLIHQLVSKSALAKISPADLLILIKELDGATEDFDPDGRVLSDAAQQVFASTPLNIFTSAGWTVADTAAAAEFWKIGTKIAATLGLRSKQPHLLVNGRVCFSLPLVYMLTGMKAGWAAKSRDLSR